MTVRVGVVDDQPLIRTGLRTMIDHAADLELVGEAATVRRPSSWPVGSGPTWC